MVELAHIVTIVVNHSVKSYIKQLNNYCESVGGERGSSIGGRSEAAGRLGYGEGMLQATNRYEITLIFPKLCQTINTV